MITHDTKTASTPQGLAQLLLGNSEHEEGDGFAKLLATLQAKDAKTDSKTPLLLKSETKTSSKESSSELLTLLHGNETAADMKADIALLDPKLTKALDTKQLVQLVHNAKAFLKGQIAKVSDLPNQANTLKGLLDVAKKVGIDITQIKIESIAIKEEKPTTLLTKKPTQDVILKPQAPSHDNLQPKPQTPVQTLETTAQKTPLNTNTVLRVDHTTQEMVQTKQNVETKPAQEEKKEKANPLRALLQISNDDGEKVINDDVVTAKVTKQPLFNQTLTQLLQGNGSNDTNKTSTEPQSFDTADVKTSQVTTGSAKSDQLTQKLVEAKQFVQHFATQLKDEVENYKPPFTRLKMKLNPIKLGEVDVTMVQRGNNVHINVSSNSAALNVLMQNATELKTQLSNNGITNASMTFNSHSDQQNQQQQHHRQQELMELYENFENSDEFELISSLDIVVPRYI